MDRLDRPFGGPVPPSDRAEGRRQRLDKHLHARIAETLQSLTAGNISLIGAEDFLAWAAAVYVRERGRIDASSPT